VICLFEGPRCDETPPTVGKLHGFRHYVLFQPSRPVGDINRYRSFISQARGAIVMQTMRNVRFFPAGTWEDENHEPEPGFLPRINPELMTELTGTAQTEMAI
jgi:hypothetical protein